MTQGKRYLQSIPRRHALKMWTVPAGMIVGRWVTACTSDGAQAGPPAVPGTGGTLSSGGVGSTGGVTPAGSGGIGPGAGGGGPASGGVGPGAGGAGSGGVGSGSGGVDPGSGGAGAMGTGGATANSGGMNPGASGGMMMDGSGGNVDPTVSADVPWATGGTGVMQGNYPDPFTSDQVGTACQLYPSQTIGPCYALSPAMREDISDGMGGLPMRLSFLVVRAGCEPIAGATVDLWHCGSDGIYSAFARGTICNPGAADVSGEMYCRGVQVTDETGRAHFNTVFPGWYTGRAVHLHFTVRINGRDEATSQLYFEDDLTTDIQSQGDYAGRGMRDVLNSQDLIFRSGGASSDQVIMSAARRPDGALHAWKVLSIG